MRRSRRAICLAAAGVTGLSVHAAFAQLAISTYYVSGEISQNSSFSAPQAVSISDTSPTIFVPLGDYFEFGLSTILTGNFNPYWDDAWAQSHLVQPEYLGLAGCGYQVASTDTNATMVAPVLGSSRGGGEYYATDFLSSVYSGSFTDVGDVEPGNGGVGNSDPIYQAVPGGSEINPDTSAGVQRLALWGGQTASPGNASPFFTQLQYQTVSTGLVGLLPVVASETALYWYVSNTNQNAAPSYSESLSGVTSNSPSVLAVYTAPSLTWTGSSSSTWNTSSSNWSSSSGSVYHDPDFVTFADGSVPTNVTLNTTVSPYLVTVNSNANNFTISGTGAISGKANILKEGTSTLTISTADSFTGGTIVDAGKLIVGVKNALSTNTPLTINGGTVQLATNTGLETFSSLSIAGNGVLDIANNHIIVNYTTSDPDAAIQQYLSTGYNNGHWNGPGIISSAAAVNTSYGLGWADGADGIVSGISSGEIEIKYTLLGDANLDGTVNGSDFSILASNFGKGLTNWDQGNFLFTPTINGADFSALATNFGKGASGADVEALDSFAIANGLSLPSPSEVPEPISLAMLAGGGLVLAWRRRRS
jgi:autotransporter-associated beta strand protein